MLSERLDGLFSMCERAKTPPGLLRAGRCRRCRSVAVRPASARPDQAEGLAAFVIEEVGVDRRGEARIVELDREIIAALAGALRPGGADLGAADKDPVAWRVVAAPVGLRNDADASGLDAEGDDLALELVAAGLLEGTDGCHLVSPWLFEPATIAVSMAIDRPQAIDAAPLGAAAQRRMAAAGLSCLARNGRSRGPRACGVASPGEESLAAAIVARRSRLAVLWPDHAIKRPRGSRARQPLKEKTWQTWSAQEVRRDERRNRNPGVRKGGRSHPGSAPALALQTPGSVGCGQRCCSIDALARAALLTVRFDDRHPPITQPDT